MKTPGALVAIVLALALSACATTSAPDRASIEARKTEQGAVLRTLAVDPRVAARILELDPERVSDHDVRTVLAAGPTPRIVGVHGGIYPVHLVMESFARFLVGMGYPEAKIRHPGDGRLSHSPYENSAQIAGTIAWYYEQEGLMPMLVGHSQGGIQAVKVLHELAGDYSREVRVWNPTTDTAEDRVTIVDPFTRTERPVVGLKVGYASAVGAGGAALLLPNQWGMMARLRTIPDSVEEFTGYSLGVDLIAWDLPGAGATYRPNGAAKVRNVQLPAHYSHVTVAATSHLARDPAMREWINAYVPGSVNGFPANAESTENALWAADVWHSIKKHWVLEAQKVVRARRSLAGAK
jgi:alpha-beta hydrolase superfamily lysophospholipase